MPPCTCSCARQDVPCLMTATCPHGRVRFRSCERYRFEHAEGSAGAVLCAICICTSAGCRKFDCSVYIFGARWPILRQQFRLSLHDRLKHLLVCISASISVEAVVDGKIVQAK